MAHGSTIEKRPVHHRLGAFAVEEFKKIVPPTLFFAVGFNLIVMTQRILVADYLLRFAGFMVATMTALLVGKAVLLANHLPFVRRYDNAPLIRPILYKTIVYWACVGVVRLIEAYLRYIYEEGQVIGFTSYMVDHFVWRQFLFVQIWILVLFAVYTTGAELNHLFGDGELFRIMFRHGSPTIKQVRRQRIRTLVALGRLADTASGAALRDPHSPEHARLVDLVNELRGDQP